jgi:hypothetical protein
MSAKDELKRLVRTIYMEGFMQVKDVNTDEYVDKIINMFSSELNTDTREPASSNTEVFKGFGTPELLPESWGVDMMYKALSSNTEPTKRAIKKHLDNLARLSERLKKDEGVSIKEDKDDIIDDLN